MSSAKRVLTPIQIITSGSMTGTSTLTSSEIDIQYLSRASIQLVWTGTPTGTFAIQGTVDGSTWSPITTNPASIAASGSAGNHLVEGEIHSKKMRVQYTNSSGTGTLNAWITAKED